ncbi:MAG TPA: prepilin-type N-terminal cleavage/methylation domain-containing protein [Pirellulales bacterium]|nr:prepilin-type N-terminal cleavage/methylation domain-containing protein [Pirellulales bacterium]
MNQNHNHVGSRKSEVGSGGRRAVVRLHPSSFILHPSAAPRRAFTLIELLIAILIIGILSSISLAALMRARQAANVANTKTTISKLHSQIQMKWDSYRTRTIPIDPKALLTTLNFPTHPYQANNAWAFIQTLRAQRSMPNDPLGVMPGNAQFPTLPQVAAVRLLAVRELQRWEMPCGWGDLVQVDSNGTPVGTPGNYYLLKPYVLASVPSLAYEYFRKLTSAAPIVSGTLTNAQIQQFDAAECLYLVVTCGTEDVAFGGELALPKSVGDADGDGLPEFHDAWPLGEQAFPVAGPQRQPISWIRWPAGFHNYQNQTYYSLPLLGTIVSDLDQDPTLPNIYDFSIGYHDYFDTLKIDVPPATAAPRGYNMMPLIFSVGPDGAAGLSPAIPFPLPSTVPAPWNDAWGIDPYIPDSYGNMAGTPIGSFWTDNIHNHLIEAR